jgi:uncharacterized membrane protein
MKKINWLIVGMITTIALLFLFGGGMMAGTYGYRGWGMMGPGMMGGWGYSPFGWFGMGIGMLFMWLVPVGILALIVFVVASLVRNNGNPAPLASQTPCHHCGKSTQADWQNCPYCGTTLK